MKRVAIIGGGVSGVIAALLLQDTFSVTIFEREESLLKKLLRTGNGKANIYRRNVKSNDYNDEGFLLPHLSRMEQTLDELFLKLGIITYTDEEGRVYPYSRSAKSLQSLLLAGLKAEVHLNTNISNVIKHNDQYRILDKDYDYLFMTVGSSAGLLSKPLDNNNTHLFRNLQLEVSPLIPVIKTIEVTEDLRLISNERQNVVMRLYRDDELIFTEAGEVLFKDHGLSGIVSFVISSHLEWSVEKHPQSTHQIRLDLVPDIPLLEVSTFIKNSEDFPRAFSLKMSKYLTARKAKNSASLIKSLSFTPVSFNNPENTQAMHGGVILDLISEHFNVVKSPTLFVLGEALNIDGVCGGLNLGFALYSSVTASNYLLNILSK